MVSWRGLNVQDRGIHIHTKNNSTLRQSHSLPNKNKKQIKFLDGYFVVLQVMSLDILHSDFQFSIRQPGIMLPIKLPQQTTLYIINNISHPSINNNNNMVVYIQIPLTSPIIINITSMKCAPHSGLTILGSVLILFCIKDFSFCILR